MQIDLFGAPQPAPVPAAWELAPTVTDLFPTETGQGVLYVRPAASRMLAWFFGRGVGATLRRRRCGEFHVVVATPTGDDSAHISPDDGYPAALAWMRAAITRALSA